MFKNYFKTAWRSLLRGKSFSVINIAGLVVGMAGATLILLWLHNEVSYDTFHRNKDRLYEVYVLAGKEKKIAANVTSMPLGPAIKHDFPQAEAVSRFIDVRNFLLTAGDRHFTNIEGGFADSSFFRLFSFPLLQGSTREQLKGVYSIVITSRLAKKLFGNADPLNKTIKIDSTDNFVVTGVLKDLPSNTRFSFDYLLPWTYLKKIGWDSDDWLHNGISTFVLVKPHTDMALFNSQIRDLTWRKANRNDVWTHFLYPLDKWHLYSEFENGLPSGGRIATVRLFGSIAVFILLIACINFMNLSTARSERRAKEVGIRKVAGARKGSLISQFMIECFVIAAIAGILALLVVQLALPAFDILIDTRLSIPYNNGFFWLSTLGFILFTSLLAGCYPAFYLSSFNPIGIFRGKFKSAQGLLSPRKVLVVLQFTFAVILIISTIVVRNQIRYAQDREIGYSRNNLVHVNFAGDIEKNYPLIKQDLLNAGVAVSVTKTMSMITRIGANTWGFRWPGRDPRLEDPIALFSTDAGLVKTAGLQLVAGRDIDIYKYPTDSLAVLLNETAVRTMGFKNPVGQMLTDVVNSPAWHVVGVVKDYIVGSPYSKIPPLVIEGPHSWFNAMHIRFNPDRSTADNLATTEAIFKKYNGNYPFDYQFVDEAYAKNFNNEQRTKTLAGLFAALAVFISCLGLFGLSAYVAESRVKEIGVRKVLGASALSIARLISVDFVRLVVISILIASPVAWYAMTRWLRDYTYHIDLGWGIFAAAGFLAILIALATVSFQSIKAAIANPVKSLRSE